MVAASAVERLLGGHCRHRPGPWVDLKVPGGHAVRKGKQCQTIYEVEKNNNNNKKNPARYRAWTVHQYRNYNSQYWHKEIESKLKLTKNYATDNPSNTTNGSCFAFIILCGLIIWDIIYSLVSSELVGGVLLPLDRARLAVSPISSLYAKLS